jgi:fatty acid-binding protein DegV
MSIQIVTDTTSDIPAALLKTLPITVIPLYITLNGKSYRDNIDLTTPGILRSASHSPSPPDHSCTLASPIRAGLRPVS